MGGGITPLPPSPSATAPPQTKCYTFDKIVKGIHDLLSNPTIAPRARPNAADTNKTRPEVAPAKEKGEERKGGRKGDGNGGEKEG